MDVRITEENRRILENVVMGENTDQNGKLSFALTYRGYQMNKIFRWFHNLSKRNRDSIYFAAAIVGGLSTMLSILGVSFGDLPGFNIWMRIVAVIFVFAVIWLIIYALIGRWFKESINLIVCTTPVSISCGDIFEASGWKVIGCDTHFDTRVDDVVISKSSLHGKLVLEHGNVDEIKAAVNTEASRLDLQENEEGLYDFPLGSVVKYVSSRDNETYLMVALTELNDDYEAHTNMAKYEQMLMKMWREIDRVYASHDLVLPVLGSGISRFDDGPKDSQSLLKCMLCTLNSSGVSLNSKVEIVLYGNADDIALYEYKDLV